MARTPSPLISALNNLLHQVRRHGAELQPIEESVPPHGDPGPQHVEAPVVQPQDLTTTQDVQQPQGRRPRKPAGRDEGGQAHRSAVLNYGIDEPQPL